MVVWELFTAVWYKIILFTSLFLFSFGRDSSEWYVVNAVDNGVVGGLSALLLRFTGGNKGGYNARLGVGGRMIRGLTLWFWGTGVKFLLGYVIWSCPG